MFPDPRKFMDDLASKIKNPDSHPKDSQSNAEEDEQKQGLLPSSVQSAPSKPSPPIDDDVKQKLSSPPSLLSDVASKLSSPPPLVADMASKLKPPGSASDHGAAKDTATTASGDDAADNKSLQQTDTASSTISAKKADKLAAKGWNMKMLPVKEHFFVGHMVPALRGGNLGLVQKSRRVVLEILPPEKDEQQQQQQGKGSANPSMSYRLQQVLEQGTTSLVSSGDDDEEVVLNSDGGEMMPSDGPVELEDGATIVLRCMKLVRKGFFAKDTDAEDATEEDDDGDPNNEWTEYKRYGLDLVQHQKTQGTYVEVRLGAGSETVVRDFNFSSEAEAQQFVRTLEACKALQAERAGRQVKSYHEDVRSSANKSITSSMLNVISEKTSSGDQEIPDKADASSKSASGKIQLLIEIVSALNVPVGDLFSSDPYVIVRMGDKEVHRTDYIPRTLDPIWTLQTGSLFLLVMTPEEYFASVGGMSFIIKDFDVVGSNKILGRVTVKLQELLNGNGERVEYDIEPPKKPEDNKKGKLVLRYKAATQEDVDFMEFYTANKNNVGTLADSCFLPPKVHAAKLLEQKSKKGPNNETLLRVKPLPDPSRVEETTWMTREKIEVESLKSSTNWIEVGSGDLGRFYVEVLGCDNLMMHDRPSIPVLAINAFACLMFEDCIVNTDVIKDDDSPSWMPWCQRAFMFHVRHPSSQLMLGIFTMEEFLPGAMAQTRSPVGRVVLSPTNICPKTNYTLQFPLYTEAGKKLGSGTVTLRVRIEWENERQALIAGLSPRSPIFVSVANRNDFSTVNYTVDGKVEQETTFTPEVFSSYIQELASYQRIIDFVVGAAVTVFLWRGTLKVGRFLVPVHSIIAFIWGVLVTQNFDRLPSFWLFSVAWFFLATMDHLRSHPSKWYRCRPYTELFQILAFSKSFAQEIASNDNLPAIEAYEAEEEKNAEKRAEKAEMDKQQKKEEDALIKDEQRTVNANEVETTSVKKATKALNPLNFLFPVQQQVGSVVVTLRIVKSIVLWQENYLAFWLVTMSLAGSFVLFWVPFGFIVRWASRIVVWGALGPWMKLVDIYWIKKQEQDATASLEVRRKQLAKLATSKQMKKERAVKLKDMTKYLFGNFLQRVPRFKEDLSPIYPLPASFASPKSDSDGEAIKFSGRYYGQLLSGDMIPQRDVKLERNNPDKPPGLVDPAKVPLLSSFASKADYGALNKTEGPLSFLFGKR